MLNYKILYKPKGKAAEYCNGYALNLYDGCEHGCKYCYAPRVRHKKAEEFFSDVGPYKDVLERLHYDLRKMVDSNDIQEIFLSFTSDPFQPCESQHQYLVENDGIYAFVVHCEGEIKRTCLKKASLIGGIVGRACGRTWSGVMV